MSSQSRAVQFSLLPPDNQRLAALCGQLDENLRQIEGTLGVEIVNRGNQFRITGHHDRVQHAQRLITALYDAAEHADTLTPSGVNMVLKEVSRLPGPIEPPTELRTPKQRVHGRTESQRRYIAQILTHDVTFGVGPAGTGKTYLAVACAVEALESGRAGRIVLARPAVEAGERLGFLPGDLEQKVDPYLRPLYDALHDMLGPERVGRLIEKGVIEVAPLAFMRGRTLNESFIILDEAQNTTAEQMKMFLTRLGFGATAVITGDVTQVDLPRVELSGLRQALGILNGVDGIAVTHFSSDDVVRHPLVQRIVEAYEAHEQRNGTALP
ncbi:MAG: PhoH family protein [Gammaproteobacteria bacterium]|nr:PhoH family protein [Gammaproteobacteria bacterium]